MTVMPPLPEDRFLCGFSHIFAGGYAAGYYSYKWAEVLSADAFAAFEEAVSNHCTARLCHDIVQTRRQLTSGRWVQGLMENGVSSVAPIGRRFRETVLGLGGSEHPMEVFKAFRGREPTVDALLRHNGLLEVGAEAEAATAGS